MQCLHVLSGWRGMFCLGLLHCLQPWHMCRLYLWWFNLRSGSKFFMKLWCSHLFTCALTSLFFEVCGSPGLCVGVEISYDVAGSEDDCVDNCRATIGFEWYSYDPSTGFCLLTTDCDTVQECDIDCVHGQSDCYQSPGKDCKVLFLAKNKFKTATLFQLSQEPSWFS